MSVMWLNLSFNVKEISHFRENRKWMLFLCFRVIKRAHWVDGTSTLRRNIQTTWTTRRRCQSMWFFPQLWLTGCVILLVPFLSLNSLGRQKVQKQNGSWSVYTMCVQWVDDEVCPCRAAFQYGIKMSEGRKTRRFKETNEKAELDRQWKKISAVRRTYLNLLVLKQPVNRH